MESVLPGGKRLLVNKVRIELEREAALFQHPGKYDERAVLFGSRRKRASRDDAFGTETLWVYAGVEH